MFPSFVRRAQNTNAPVNRSRNHIAATPQTDFARAHHSGVKKGEHTRHFSASKLLKLVYMTTQHVPLFLSTFPLTSSTAADCTLQEICTVVTTPLANLYSVWSHKVAQRLNNTQSVQQPCVTHACMFSSPFLALARSLALVSPRRARIDFRVLVRQ